MPEYHGYPYKKNQVTDVSSTESEALAKTKNDQKRPNGNYQGYPYVTPVVTEAPSLNPDEIAARSKWQNLPRRPLGQPREDGRSQQTDLQPSGSKYPDYANIKLPEQSSLASDSRPVVYIDIPEGSSLNSPNKSDLDPDRPVVYIDIPEGPSRVADRRPELDSKDLDVDRPVLYIDIPENNGSDVSQSIEEREPDYVQETIFYDQFKDRRIEVTRDSDSGGSTGSSESRSGPTRPQPPNTLNIGSPGSSGFGSGSSSPPRVNHTQSPYNSKEAYIYGQRTPDEFTLPPLPVNEFPNYPPPYEEIASTPVSVAQTVTEPPRTQVITPAAPIQPVIVGSRRKYVQCQFCNNTVQTLVVLEHGRTTHLIALVVFIFFAFFAILVYCYDCFKQRNHYCPVCNKRIGYQGPTACCMNNMTYIS